jgi:hypothetical protein
MAFLSVRYVNVAGAVFIWNFRVLHWRNGSGARHTGNGVVGFRWIRRPVGRRFSLRPVKSRERGFRMVEGFVGKSRGYWGRWILANGTVAAWTIYGLTSAVEAINPAVAFVDYFVLALSLASLAGSAFIYLSAKE